MFDRELALLRSRPFVTVYEGNEEPPPGETPPTDPPAPEDKNKPKVKLDQAQQSFVNSLLAEEKRKAQQKNDLLITQLETERNRAGTTEAEKVTLAERIEALKSEYATQDELKSRDNKKKLDELEKKHRHSEAEAKTWRQRFEKKQKVVDLTTAAVAEKAFSADQVVLVLEPNTRLVEIVGEDGKPTGEFETKVKLSTTDKDGKAVTLDLTPTEAVKQLKEMPERYGNLFISGASGGLGGGNLSRGGKGGAPDKSQMTTPEYMAERRKERAANPRRKYTG